MGEQTPSQEPEPEAQNHPPEQPPETPTDAGVSGSESPPPTQDELNESEFAKLFEEGEPEAPPDKGAEEGEPPPEGEDPGGSEGEGEPEGESPPVEGAESPEGDQPAEGGEGEQQAQPAQPEKPERPPETEIQAEPEWWTDLPDEAKAQIGQLHEYANQQYQANSAMYGRLAPVQRENAYLREQLQKAEQAQATTPTLDDLEKSNAYKAITEEFPDEAKELKTLFTSQARAIQQAQTGQQRYQQAVNHVQQTYKQREYQRLAQVVPEFQQLMHHPRFQEWKQAVVANPQMFGDLRQKLTSDFYEDSVDVLNQFRTHWAQAYPDEFSRVYPNAQAGQPNQTPQGQPAGNGQAQPQTKPQQRPKPPNPSPPSQGAGVSGTTRKHPPRTDEERFAALFED